MKKIFFFAIIFFAFFGWAENSSAATLYVATTGSDTTGSGASGNPWRTVQKCANTMSEGDVCSVAAGNYDEGVTLSVSGLDDARRSIFVSTGGYAVLRYVVINASYVTVDGFEITQPNGAAYTAITFNRVNPSTAATKIIVQNCYIHDTVWSKYAISVYLAPYPTDVNIKNNIVKNIWGPAMIVKGSRWTIEGNTFSDINSDIAFYSGDHHAVQDNIFKFVSEGNEGHHADFFQNIATTGSDILTDFLVQRNILMYGANVQIGNFNNDAGCPGNNLTFRNNIVYAITDPFNYAGCNSYWYNNTIIFSAMATGAHPVSVTTNQLTDGITMKNNLFVGNATEGNLNQGGFYTPSFANLTEGNNMVTAWPSSVFAGLNLFNTDNGNINGGDPGLANLPVSVYPSMDFGETGWNFEISSNPSWYLDNSIWMPGPGTGVEGSMFYSPGNVGWTYNGPWTYHAGGGDWTQYYAEHTTGGTGTLVYDNFTPVIGRRYGISMRMANSTITGSITPSIGGQVGITCTSANIAGSGWCPNSYVVVTDANKLTFTPSADFRSGLWQVSVWWAPSIDEYDISASEKHSGSNSLHLQGLANGSTVNNSDSAGFGPAFFVAEAWVKLVSGGIRFFVEDADHNRTIIDSTTQAGSWVKLSGNVTYQGGNAYFGFESTADDTEVYIDDVDVSMRFMATNSIQYTNQQAAILTVGSNISINGDGVCRTILTKDPTNQYVTFSPALSVAPGDNAWIEAWGNRTNCVLDLRLTTSSIGPRAHGADLSASFADDFSGNTRTTWDIGAYEFVAAGDVVAPSAPSGLSIL